MAIFRKQESQCPSDVLDWIAWYDEPELPEEVRNTIDRHAAECLECRQEIAWVQDEAALQASPPDDGEEVLERVLARARAEDKVTPIQKRPRAVLQPALAAAAALMLVAGLGWILTTGAGDDAAYRTASGPAAAAHDVEVIFRDDASWSQVSALLTELDVVESSGPTPSTQGRVQLRLSDGQPLNVALNSLRSSKLTIFAEPVAR